MATSQMSEFILHLRRAVLLWEWVGLTDGQLLEDYLSRREEATSYRKGGRRVDPRSAGVRGLWPFRSRLGYEAGEGRQLSNSPNVKNRRRKKQPRNPGNPAGAAWLILRPTIH